MIDQTEGGIYLNANELNKLDEKEAELWHLYVAGLRRRMDPATGIADCDSYFILGKFTMVGARPGIGGKKYDKQKLQRMLARLVEIGLLEPCDAAQRLAFNCVLADRAGGSASESDGSET